MPRTLFSALMNPSEGVVAASVVVVLDPWSERVGSVSVGEEGLAVGPLDLQRAVEAFDLAVLPRAVRLDEDVLDVVVGEELA